MKCPFEDLEYYDFYEIHNEAYLATSSSVSILRCVIESSDRPEHEQIGNALRGVERILEQFMAFLHEEESCYLEQKEEYGKKRALAQTCRLARTPKENGDLTPCQIHNSRTGNEGQQEIML